MLIAKLEVLGDIDRRGAIRLDADSPSTLRMPGGEPVDVQVEDFSRTGFRFVAPIDLPLGTLVSLGLSGAGARAARVMRRKDSSYGCAFMKPLSDEEVARAFRGQEQVLAELSTRIEERFAAAAAERARRGVGQATAMIAAAARLLRR